MEMNVVVQSNQVLDRKFEENENFLSIKFFPSPQESNRYLTVGALQIGSSVADMFKFTTRFYPQIVCCLVRLENPRQVQVQVQQFLVST